MPDRSPWQVASSRFRRDRWSSVGAGVFVVIVLLSFAGGPVLSRVLGHNGYDQFPYSSNLSQKPVGPWTWVPALPNSLGTTADGGLAPPPRGTKTTLFVFGADGPLGRDELIRVLDGGKTSLEVAIGGMLIALLIGVPLGSLAGYFGGVADVIVSRFTETIMAFPLMLFLVFASVQFAPALSPIGYGWWLPPGVFAEALLIGVFTSFYPTRLVRAQLLELRNAEFVEALEMVGASRWRILSRNLLPHLLPTMLIWGAIAVATNILLEVGLSFVGAGVQVSTATWGSLLSTTWGTLLAPQTYDSQTFTPWQTVFPTISILLAVVSLNQVSEGLRRALDPRSRG
ncbi:MAG TPA: ABC transporter permease [Microbacteriaceae bacterium]|jgi:ABC-type dipeptide/oligopeptide/nickel transport system permease subunit|nr:ABC transporter permease [Microbacteriaceae bacterium]